MHCREPVGWGKGCWEEHGVQAMADPHGQGEAGEGRPVHRLGLGWVGMGKQVIGKALGGVSSHRHRVVLRMQRSPESMTPRGGIRGLG